jgi:hypothetical protein
MFTLLAALSADTQPAPARRPHVRPNGIIATLARLAG